MSFYVKLKENLEAKRFRFLDTEDGTTPRRAKAMAYPDRDVALARVRRLLEERKGCLAHVVNEKGRARPLTVTESHPGALAVAKATALSEDLVRALAGVPGCPIVRGGRGTRFASVEAFRGFVAGLTPEQRLHVPAYLRDAKLKLAGEIGKIAWGSVEASLARKYTYPQLQAMLARWQEMDKQDKARVARKALCQ